MMSFVSDRPTPGQVDPRDLTAGQLAALRTVAEFRLSRIKGGWQAPGSPKVTLPTAQFLGFKRLVMRRTYNGRERLEATGAGLNTLAVAEQRKTRRGSGEAATAARPSSAAPSGAKPRSGDSVRTGK